MKKNVMMRLACFLMVAVLISTSAISGTYAKYVTSGEAEDTARVAKFGVTVTGKTDIFSDAYLDASKVYVPDEELDNITVEADTAGTDVVAPGTNGTLSAFEITGTPEVDTQVAYTVEFELGDKWVVGTEEYCPIIFTVVNNGVAKTYGMSFTSATEKFTSVAALEAGVKKAIEDCQKRYHTNDDLSDAEDDMSISWEWPFSTGDDNDKKDTALGDAAAANTANAGSIYLKVTCSVTQIN